jgi:hypothetical protein
MKGPTARDTDPMSMSTKKRKRADIDAIVDEDLLNLSTSSYVSSDVLNDSRSDTHTSFSRSSVCSSPSIRSIQDSVVVRVRIPRCLMPLDYRNAREESCFTSCLNRSGSSIPPSTYPGMFYKSIEGYTAAAQAVHDLMASTDLAAAPVGSDSWLTGTLIDFILMRIAREYPNIYFLTSTFAHFDMPNFSRTLRSGGAKAVADHGKCI